MPCDRRYDTFDLKRNRKNYIKDIFSKTSKTKKNHNFFKGSKKEAKLWFKKAILLLKFKKKIMFFSVISHGITLRCSNVLISTSKSYGSGPITPPPLRTMSATPLVFFCRDGFPYGRHKKKRLSFGHCPKGGGWFNRIPKVVFT